MCVVAIPATRPPEESKGALLEVVGREELQGQMHLGVSSVVALRAGDIPSDGGVTGNGHTRTPSRHISHNSGGVMGAVSPMLMGMSYRGGYQGGVPYLYIYVFKIKHIYIYILQLPKRIKKIERQFPTI